MKPKSRRKQGKSLAVAAKKMNVPFFRAAAVLVVVAGVAVGVFLGFFAGCNSPGTPTVRTAGPEELLCRRFMELKNAGDPATAELLGPVPVVPADPVTEEEAQRLDTEIFLRRDCRILDVRPANPAGSDARRFILVVDGNLSSEAMRVGTSPVSTRQIYNPDLTVEVRDGKIYGVRCGIREEPNQRPLTPAEARRLRELLIGEEP